MADDYEALKLDRQLCFPLYAAARRVVNSYGPLLRPLGITYTEYIVFMVLWEEGDVTVSRLGRRLMLDSGTLTPLLKRMERHGYVERRRLRDDERFVTVSLTERGRAMRERAIDIPAEMAGCVPLTQEEAETLCRLLYRILER